MPTISRGRYRRELLPPARAFYEAELGELRRASRDWAKPKAGCPFHPSKSQMSFSVNVVTGAYYCFGCQAKGDMLSFVRLRYGMSFAAAAKYLGCWDDHGRAPRPRSTVQVPFLVCDFVIDGASYRAEVPDSPRNELARLHRIHAEAADRLRELREGDAEIYEGEGETQWAILELSWQLIELEVGQ